MADPVVYISKNDLRGLCEVAQLPAMIEAGWQECDPPAAPQSEPESQVETDRGANMIRMFRDGHEAWCEPGQVANMVEAGWSDNPSKPVEIVQSDDGESEEVAPGVIEAFEVDESASVRQVLSALDPDDDAFWHGTGRVKLTVVNETFGLALTGVIVETAWPGFSREVARSAR